MAKQTGLGDGLVVDGIDLSGDTGGLNAIGASRPTHNVTGINSSGQERVHLLKNGRIEWSSHFNPDNAHDELSALPTDDRIVTYLRGQTRGDPAASMVAKQINYDPTRAADGSMDISLQTQSNAFGLEWGVQLTSGFEDFNSTGVKTAHDTGLGETDFGLQAYLHVLEFTGTNVIVTIEDDGGAIGSGVAFESMTAVGAQRIQTDRDETVTPPFNINLSGTFTTCTLLVAVTQNLQSVRF